MRKQAILETVRPAVHQAELDLVVPFTTPELTKTALEAASGMGTGLNAALRLVRVQVIPAQLDICQSPVGVNFLKQQLWALMPEIRANRELRFARDWKAGLESTLTPDSLIVMAAPGRFWTTKNERTAEALRRDGYRVVLVSAAPAARPVHRTEVVANA